MGQSKVNITVPKVPNIELHLTGDWVKAQSLIDGIDKSIGRGYDKAREEFSKGILKIVKNSLKSGLPPRGTNWPLLAASTIRTYGAHNIYYLTGLYARSVGVHKYSSRTIIGLPINRKLPGKSLTLNQLAVILEHGNDIIPARPLWAPSFKAYGGKDKLKKITLSNIRSQIFRDYGINPKQVRG